MIEEQTVADPAPLPSGTPEGRQAWRSHNVGWYLVVLLASAAGAILLFSAAPAILAWLYDLVSSRLAPPGSAKDAYRPNAIVSGVPFAVLGALLGGWIGNVIYSSGERIFGRWESMDIGDKVTVFFGLFVGLFGSIPFVVLVQALQLVDSYRVLLITGVILFFTSVSVYALQSISEILPWNRSRARIRRSGLKVLDTNVIIDGRIYDVVRSGFVEGKLYVPGFVLDELQFIADSHDALRRQRGRRGLEVLRHLQSDFPMEVRTHDKLIQDVKEPVDQRLVRLAKVLGADIVTNDWNLNQVAKLQEVKVLNINDLALALRSNILPQETFEIGIVREGNQAYQGVGYLEDGTMVVVENGKAYVGETVTVVVTQVIQTERGKMIFGEIAVDTDENGGRRRPLGTRRNSGH